MKETIEERARYFNSLTEKTYHQIIYCCSSYKNPFDDLQEAQVCMDELMKKHKEKGYNMGGAYIDSYSEITRIADDNDEAKEVMEEMAQLIADQRARIKELEDYSTNEINQFQKEINELKAFIAEKYMGWKEYPISGNKEQRAYAPNKEAALAIPLGMSLWKHVDEFIKFNKSEESCKPSGHVRDLEELYNQCLTQDKKELINKIRILSQLVKDQKKKLEAAPTEEEINAACHAMANYRIGLPFTILAKAALEAARKVRIDSVLEQNNNTSVK